MEIEEDLPGGDANYYVVVLAKDVVAVNKSFDDYKISSAIYKTHSDHSGINPKWKDSIWESWFVFTDYRDFFYNYHMRLEF